MTATHVLRRRRGSRRRWTGRPSRSSATASQGHAHARNLHESGVDVVVGLTPGSKSRALAEDGGPPGRGRRRRREGRRRDHDRGPRHAPEGGLRRRDRAEPPARPAADVRPRLQHPVRPDRAAAADRRRDGRAQGPGPPPPLRLRAGRRRAGPVRGRAATRPARPAPASSPTPAASAPPGPASSRRRSRRRPRPTCSASRRSCAAACRRSSRRRSRRSSRPATSPSSPTSRRCTSSS